MVRAGIAIFVALALPASAQDRHRGLIFPPDLASGIAALPRLAASDSASLRINDRLTALDQEAVSDAAACNTDPPRSDFARWVEVAFAGPRFLSLLVMEDVSCTGSAHPEESLMPITFDLTSGEEVDLQSLFPTEFKGPRDASFPDAFHFGPALTRLYLSLATSLPQDCREVIRAQDNWFAVWLNQPERGIGLMPFGLPHVAQDCGDIVVLPLKQMRELGFDPVLLHALEDTGR